MKKKKGKKSKGKDLSRVTTARLKKRLKRIEASVEFIEVLEDRVFDWHSEIGTAQNDIEEQLDKLSDEEPTPDEDLRKKADKKDLKDLNISERLAIIGNRIDATQVGLHDAEMEADAFHDALESRRLWLEEEQARIESELDRREKAKKKGR